MQWQIMKLLKAFLLYGLLITAVSCSSDTEKYDLIGNFPVPEGAYDVKKLTFGTSNTQQLFFRIKERYPSTRITEIYRSFLQDHGWTRCPGSKNGWSSHEDRTSDPYLLVHQLIEYWVYPDDNKLLILKAMYYSKELDKEKPDNDEQHIIVWVQHTRNLEKELSELRVDCGDGI